MKGRVLVVAGSDSGGGAGIQADIKTITALNGFAMTAITALTAQNSIGVAGVLKTPPGFVADQIRVTLEDLGADAVKTGMMADAPIIEAAAEALEEHAGGVPWVVDPVMFSSARDRLLDEDAAEAMKARLVSRAALVTPNMAEAEALSGRPVTTVADMEDAGRALLDLGAGAALVTGGHLGGDAVTDVLVAAGGAERFESPRIDTPHIHGTGCTLASAVAIGLAQGMELRDCVIRARNYIIEAIRSAPGYGSGHGPLNHAHTVRPFGDGSDAT
ncbi:MAG: bifunctional hydroxymethylpyrimidine kinase/phosphomethylpyrimidine kinase [Rhodospirillaceae bacterium]|jgi:hydroxymethylpyrimidine/phosphomethylpyrimidine kinase|nr:bifunctional hydroxymethylpyrimidine kinase/phosphomethylpyrimidine kinase [Rhodospirillaceae bacterium]|tara:strand:+ start:317 stop:1135 length:819 start_codon:yes stop_codon:yes gene_type:complete